MEGSYLVQVFLVRDLLLFLKKSVFAFTAYFIDKSFLSLQWFDLFIVLRSQIPQHWSPGQCSCSLTVLQPTSSPGSSVSFSLCAWAYTPCSQLIRPRENVNFRGICWPDSIKHCYHWWSNRCTTIIAVFLLMWYAFLE